VRVKVTEMLRKFNLMMMMMMMMIVKCSIRWSRNKNQEAAELPLKWL